MAVITLIDIMWAGNRRLLRFTVTDEDGSGAKDLTGLIVKFALARFDTSGNPVKSNPLIDKRSDTSSDVTITTPLSGIVEVVLVPADTASITPVPAAYYMELEVFNASNADPVVVATGTLTINRNVDNA